MRETRYVPGYGYVTKNEGNGFWQDAGIDLASTVGRRVATAIGDKIGRKIADKIVSNSNNSNSNNITTMNNESRQTREDVLKQLELLPNIKPTKSTKLKKSVVHPSTDEPLSDDIKKLLYGKK